MGGLLLMGYGNPGRGDDGLGPALAEALAARGLPGLRVDTAFQLNIEDAHALMGCEAVVFADAAKAGPEPFAFRRVEAGDAASFSSHSVSPAGLLALARQLFGAEVRGYTLAIRGYEFDEFGAPLSLRARHNLKQALAFIEPRLRSGQLGEAFPAGAAG